MIRNVRKLFWVGLIGYAVLFISWVASPAYRSFRGFCPVRPGPVGDAGASPAFARRYGISCSQCHAAFPALNEYGRQFKMNGYVRERGKADEGFLDTKSDAMHMLKAMPLGAVVVSRPYDKSQGDREFKMTAVNALKVFIAGGNMAEKNISLWSELEAAPADASPRESAVVHLPDLVVGYHPSQYLNFLAGNRSFFAMDPYQTLANPGRVTKADRPVALQGHSSLDTMDHDDKVKQTVAVYGEVDKEGLGGIYYAAGVSAGKDDPEGKGPKNTAVRLAFDTLKGAMVGAFGSFGHTGGETLTGGGLPQGDYPRNKTKFSRVGVDTLLEFHGFTSRGVFIYSYDRDLANPPAAYPDKGNETNRSAYGELFYAFKKGERPYIVPLVRQSWYQTNDGKRQYGILTAQLAHYVKENIKWFIEYTADTKQDIAAPNNPRMPKDHRWIAQIELGF